MAGNPKADEYRAARIASAVLLIVVVCIVLVFDAASTQFDTNPLILTPILIFAAGLLGVDLNIRRGDGE